jgi:regulator of protease activity HflC (stomatin/prohibitin superfamily)
MFSSFVKTAIKPLAHRTFFSIIRQDKCAVVTTFGKYSRTVAPGLMFYIPLIQRVTKLSTQVKTHSGSIHVRTNDQVMVTLKIDVNWRMPTETASVFLFNVDNNEKILDSFLNDESRTLVKTYELDSLMWAREELKSVICNKLAERTKDYGFHINEVIITDIIIPKELSDAMSAISTSLKQREAAVHYGEAEKVKIVKRAEADRAQMILQGEGIAGMRQKITEGYESSITGMAQRMGVSPEKLMEFVMNTMMLDAYKDLAQSKNTKMVFFPTSIKDAPFVYNDTIKELNTDR